MTVLEDGEDKVEKYVESTGAFVQSIEDDEPLTLAAMGMSSLSFERNEGLIAACRTGTLAEVKAWLRQGADVNAKGSIGGLTGLHGAAGRGSLEAVQFLIEEGADVNAPDTFGNTPQWFAGNPETLEALIDAGADLSIMSDGETVLDWAGRKGFDWNAKVLRCHGAKTGCSSSVEMNQTPAP